ncbi:CU044_2847 family protein [Streptomyces sp. AB3(2024)]|uniref:CU044_2847 family protein n=1 Tax=Streptomyces sp. AB3(2024) TaxID=3317321 RepID=UPI0035A2A2EE
MAELVRFDGPDGASLIVEVEEDSPGLERISRDSDGVVRAGRRLEDALTAVRPAIRSVVDSVKALAPDEYEVEFGMKLNAESGVVIAKTAMEGHFSVRIHWSRSTAGPAD